MSPFWGLWKRATALSPWAVTASPRHNGLYVTDYKQADNGVCFPPWELELRSPSAMNAFSAVIETSAKRPGLCHALRGAEGNEKASWSFKKNGAPTVCGFLRQIFSRRQSTLPSSPWLPLTFLNCQPSTWQESSYGGKGLCSLIVPGYRRCAWYTSPLWWRKHGEGAAHGCSSSNIQLLAHISADKESSGWLPSWTVCPKAHPRPLMLARGYFLRIHSL